MGEGDLETVWGERRNRSIYIKYMYLLPKMKVSMCSKYVLRRSKQVKMNKNFENLEGKSKY